MNRQSLVLSDEQREELFSTVPSVSGDRSKFFVSAGLHRTRSRTFSNGVHGFRTRSTGRWWFHVRVSRGACVRGAAPMIRHGVRPPSRNFSVHFGVSRAAGTPQTIVEPGNAACPFRGAPLRTRAAEVQREEFVPDLQLRL